MLSLRARTFLQSLPAGVEPRRLRTNHITLAGLLILYSGPYDSITTEMKISRGKMAATLCVDCPLCDCLSRLTVGDKGEATGEAGSD